MARKGPREFVLVIDAEDGKGLRISTQAVLGDKQPAMVKRKSMMPHAKA